MPNYCDYAMRIQGKKANVEKFYSWISAQYNYGAEKEELKVFNIKDDIDVWTATDEDKIPAEHHIGYRVFSAYQEYFEETESGDWWMQITGDCAWSVYSCMFKGDVGTYMGDVSYGRPDDKAISIDDASRELELQIEIFSSEPGCCFSEHYYIDKGDIVIQQETQFQELWLEYFDKESETFDEEAYNELDDDFRELVDEAIENGEDYIFQCDFWLDDEDSWDWEYL